MCEGNRRKTEVKIGKIRMLHVKISEQADCVMSVGVCVFVCCLVVYASVGFVSPFRLAVVVRDATSNEV